MFAEDIAKRIEKKALPAEGVFDTALVKSLGARLDEATLGRMLFEITAAARVNVLREKHAFKMEMDAQARRYMFPHLGQTA